MEQKLAKNKSFALNVEKKLKEEKVFASKGLKGFLAGIDDINNVSSNLTDENNVVISESINKSDDIPILNKVKDYVNIGIIKFKASPNKVAYSIVGGFVAFIILWIIIGVATSTSKLTGKWENSRVGYILFTDDGNKMVFFKVK